MNKRKAAILALVVGVASLTASCTMLDTVTGLFDSGPKKSKLRGERISVMTSDVTLHLDEALKSVPVVLPPPYTNKEWP
jgi:outer membrane protein assembly factor BamB